MGRLLAHIKAIINMNLLSNVNLDGINFHPDGRTIELEFIDMDEGDSVGTIKCTQVFICHYQNTFEYDDGFACYVGEVECHEIISEDIVSLLEKHNYGFTGNSGGIYKPVEDSLFKLHLESGEILLDVICGDVEFNKA
ncbi:hypothetical protein [Vibrio aerogenes]|uniref:hypothetical protein n=1 Tax=Vibrio aerogenes TaxID=92172 RepID=UPI00111472CF|nr:hypothetical protein [Vibrio aerogenes]